MQDLPGTPLSAAEPDRPPARPHPPRGRSRAVLGLLAVLVLVLDQASKAWALAALTPGQPVDVLGRVLRLSLIRNPGAAFSLGDGATWVLTLVSLAILGWVLLGVRRVAGLPWSIALGLLLGGALGNLLDRLVREPGPGRGHVVDFIDYAGLFVGNVADIAIVTAAGIIMVLAYRGVPLGGHRTRPARGDG
ncbi:signal peptidase II [Phycicoccus endophyticus]|uniref:Lipoprotein signal peptidase n=1 Tax=Phycicoccus endophyticus TaxID=1690220 RepID=A0A7G9R535_9MICO|nr:signal peptidase II [Phycicoccus endophyticus]NHI20899.1 signal peptidase II [Phycicoccus endophyticus]QNN50710.1 signal peptidase II [Phycicoccus endophyticus]GGL22098.1 lipoprotein signal peptidase [Phycicoccus endophyticus]